MSWDHFWAKVQIGDPTECWPWTAARNSTGYGSVGWRHEGKTRIVSAHRLAAYIHGLINDPRAPKDRRGSGFVLHSCDNRLCCNQLHFEIGTYRKNQSDAYARARRAAFKGSTHTNAMLTPEQVETIRTTYTHGCGETMARQYGVGPTTILNVVHRRTYT